jgi:hypothetical protein
MAESACLVVWGWHTTYSGAGCYPTRRRKVKGNDLVLGFALREPDTTKTMYLALRLPSDISAFQRGTIECPYAVDSPSPFDTAPMQRLAQSRNRYREVDEFCSNY